MTWGSRNQTKCSTDHFGSSQTFELGGWIDNRFFGLTWTNCIRKHFWTTLFTQSDFIHLSIIKWGLQPQTDLILMTTETNSIISGSFCWLRHRLHYASYISVCLLWYLMFSPCNLNTSAILLSGTNMKTHRWCFGFWQQSTKECLMENPSKHVCALKDTKKCPKRRSSGNIFFPSASISI